MDETIILLEQMQRRIDKLENRLEISIEVIKILGGCIKVMGIKDYSYVIRLINDANKKLEGE